MMSIDSHIVLLLPLGKLGISKAIELLFVNDPERTSGFLYSCVLVR